MMKRLLRLALALTLCLTLYLCLMPSAHAAGVFASGNWGNLHWDIDNNGVLTISGNGDMNDLPTGAYPGAWRASANYVSSIYEVVVNSGVTSLGKYAFFGCDNIERITLPDGLMKIGVGSVAVGDNLEYIRLPESLTQFDDGFGGSSKLISCGPIASGCNIEYGWKTSIPARAFYNCSSMTSIILPNSISSIGNYAFNSCSSLANVYYAGTQTQWNNINFGSGNNPLQNATIHYNSTGPAATYTVTYNANGGSGAPASQTKTQGQSLTLSSTKPTRANSSAGNYTVTLNANGGSVSTTSLTAARTTSYTFKNWNTRADGSGTSYSSGGSYTANANVTLYAQWNSSTSTASVTLPTPTHSGYIFQGWATSSSASSGVTGSYTPSGNVTLYAVWKVLEQYTINYNANGGSDAPASQTKTQGQTLTLSTTKPTHSGVSAGSYTVTLDANGGSVSPTSLTAAITTSYTFKNWNTAADGSGTGYSSGGSFTKDANTTLYAQWNSSTTTASVTLPTPEREGYVFMGWGTSSDATSGASGSYTPGGNVTLYAVWQGQASGTWGKLSWSLDYNGLLTISGNGDINDFSEYSDSAWRSYKNDITSVVIEPGVYSIGSFAFSECSSLASITIPASMSSMDQYSFYNCNSLNAVHISDLAAWCKISFNNYYSYPLWYAHNLYLNGTLITDLVIPEDITSIGREAFYGCKSLRSVIIPEGVTSIGYGAFRSSGVSKVVIPSSLKAVGEFAFDGCPLNDVHISDLAAWCRISYDHHNDSLSEYARPQTYNLYLNGMLVKDLVIPEDITYIGDHAFRGCSSLTNVVIPGRVTQIGKKAFFGCSNLMSVTIQEGVSGIGWRSFINCSRLTSVTIPDSVTSIGNYAFSGCSNLEFVFYGGSWDQWNSISIGSNNTPLQNATIIYKPDLILPAFLTTIEDEAFEGGAFTYVKLPEGAESIGYHAFAACPKLRYIYIPDGCAIDGEAFAGVSGLTILGKTGGSVQTWAGEHGYTFIAAA